MTYGSAWQASFPYQEKEFLLFKANANSKRIWRHKLAAKGRRELPCAPVFRKVSLAQIHTMTSRFALQSRGIIDQAISHWSILCITCWSIPASFEFIKILRVISYYLLFNHKHLNWIVSVRGFICYDLEYSSKIPQNVGRKGICKSPSFVCLACRGCQTL